MVSLGTEAFCGRLIASESVTVHGSITTTGAVTAAHKKIGSDVKNQGELHHNGSVFYIKWSAVHQVSTFDTTQGSTNVHWTTTAAHGLAQGDTVHIGSIPNNPNPITEVNGIPVDELTGTFQVLATPTAAKLTVQVITAANITSSSNAAVPLLRIDRYRYTDMAASTATWQNSTTLPTPSHTNIELFYS